MGATAMIIKYAILGILSYQPQTGYDLKKVMSSSAAMYWSGNNNQIYTTLVDLLDEELVTKEVYVQEKGPARKVYSITDKGRSALKSWVLSTPEPPEFRSTFLIQLMWAAQAAPAELAGLLDRYEHEVRIQLLMQREQARRGTFLAPRTATEERLWSLIAANIAGVYERELEWIERVRREMGGTTS